MLALAAAILLGLSAFGVDPDAVDLFILGLALWAAHFAFELAVPGRRG